MKKLTAIALCVALLLSLCACSGGKDENGKADSGKDDGGVFSNIISGKIFEKTTTTTMPAEEASHVAQKIEHGRFDSFDGYSDEEKEKIKDFVEQDGYTLEYNEDGSGTLSNEEGSWFVGKGWVDNEYTASVPPVNFGTVTMSSEYEEKGESYYIFLVKETSAATVQEYTEKLKAAGFTEDVESQSDVDAGIVTFCASNSGGKRVEAAYSSYGFTLKIFK